MAYALKRQDSGELDGLSITEDGVLPVAPGHLGYTDDVEKYEYDLDKAKALMKEAGYENGFDLGKYVASPIYLRTGNWSRPSLKRSVSPSKSRWWIIQPCTR